MSQSYELEGTLKIIEEIQTFASGFSKREFVVEVEDGRFPQFIKFECLKEKANQLDDLQIGDPVRVSFDIRGNEYKGKYYVNLTAWKIERPGEKKRSNDPNSRFGTTEKRGNASARQDESDLEEAPGGYDTESGDDIPF